MATTQYNPLVLASGDLIHSITFLEKTNVIDASGNTETWASAGKVSRAKIDPMRGLELIRSGVDVTQNYITISIRYRDDVDATMRVQFESKVYLIEAIENVLERNRVLKLTCLGLGSNN